MPSPPPAWSRRLRGFAAASICIASCWVAAPAVALNNWPGDGGTEIGNVGGIGGLPAGFDPSGVVWHPGRGTFIVVSDDGRVAEFGPNGESPTTWTLSGAPDLEAVALRNPASSLVYLGVEHPDSVLEFDLATGTLTGESWDLTPWLIGDDTKGLEALTVVDDLFFAGHQDEGSIYVFDLQAGGGVIHQGTIPSPVLRTDLSGLHYDAVTDVLYAIHDTDNVILEMTTLGIFRREYDLPQNKQEGVTVIADCASAEAVILVVEDNAMVHRYEQYPAVCPWPGGGDTDIGNIGGAGGLPSEYATSGAVWHPGLARLVVVDDAGRVSTLGPNGESPTTWSVAGAPDLEAVTLKNPASSLVYLGVEHPDSVLEFDLSTGTLTGNSWDLTPWLMGKDTKGLEALTVVDGSFYAGHQDEGNVYVFDLQPGGGVVHQQTIASPRGRVNLSGLHYDKESGILFAIHDNDNVIIELTPSGDFRKEYDLPHDEQEGVALGGCHDGQRVVFIAEDDRDLRRYYGYPLRCGVPSLPALGSAGRPLLGASLVLAALFGMVSKRRRTSSNDSEAAPASAGRHPQ